MSTLNLLLKSAYGIISEFILPTPGGFSTKAAYRVVDVAGLEFFLKVYDKSLPTTRFFVERIDFYMPVLNWLSRTPALCGRILTPIQTQSGTYKVETDSDVYVLFLFVKGNVPGIQGMTHAQTMELAETLALLHNIGETTPFEFYGLDEDISLSFCKQLTNFLNNVNVKCGALYELVSPHVELLHSAIQITLQLRDTTRLGYSPLVLCHGDAHGNNVIQSEHLVLADWEDLRRAPAEADLFIYAWHPHGDTLLATYAAIRRGYNINRELLYFYVLRRRIEDVWVDIQRMTEENPDEAEKKQLLNFICQGIEEIQKVYRNKSIFL